MEEKIWGCPQPRFRARLAALSAGHHALNPIGYSFLFDGTKPTKRLVCPVAPIYLLARGDLDLYCSTISRELLRLSEIRTIRKLNSDVGCALNEEVDTYFGVRLPGTRETG